MQMGSGSSSDFGRKVTSRDITDDVLEAELRKIAEQLPQNCQQKLDNIASTRAECGKLVDELEGLNSRTNVERLVAAAAKFATTKDADGDEDMEKSSVGPGKTQPEYDETNIAERVTNIDNFLKSINTSVAEVRTYMHNLFTDLGSVKITQEVQDYLRYKKELDVRDAAKKKKEEAAAQAKAEGKEVAEDEEKDGEKKEEEQELKEVPEPNTAEMKPMVLLKYRLLGMQRDLEMNSEFFRTTQKRKVTGKDELHKKLNSFRKAEESRELAALGAELLAEINAKEAELLDLDEKKRKTYFEITGDKHPSEKNMVKKEEKKDEKKEEDKDKEGEKKEEEVEEKKERPIHSASKIANLGIVFENQVAFLETFAEDMLKWMSENEPGKKLNSKEKFKLLTAQEKGGEVQKVSVKT